MVSATEAAQGRTPLGADLEAGLENLSLDQTVEFTLYIRVVLPIDGYVFWVRADLVSNAVIQQIVGTGVISSEQMTRVKIKAKGSLHLTSSVGQEEAETFATNTVVFTALQEVQDLNAVGPQLLYIGKFKGQRFAFSNRRSFYRQAALYNYVGTAIYPDMETQIIDDISVFDSADAIVSNSLPAWLALNNYTPFYGFGNNIPLFPSFLSPLNEAPPFGTVHVNPDATRALSSAPLLDISLSHSQLCADTVKITLWGTRNFNALDFVDCVNQYSLDVGLIGIMNIPVMHDEKRTQAELTTIAMKKSITFEVSYLQTRTQNVGRGLIKSSLVAFHFQNL